MSRKQLITMLHQDILLPLLKQLKTPDSWEESSALTSSKTQEIFSYITSIAPKPKANNG